MQRESSGSVRVFYPRFKREDLLKTLSERIKKLEEKLPVVRAILFGSYARGNYTVGSDVDLLIVYRGEERGEAYALTKEVLDIPRLEPHLYTEKDYKEMKETIGRMVNGGVVILSHGEE